MTLSYKKGEEAACEESLQWSLSCIYVTQTEALPGKDPVFTELEPYVISSWNLQLPALVWGQKRILLLLHQ